MPSLSKAQQALLALGEHHPEKVRPENRDVLKMSHSQLHDFASTPTKGLPEHVRKGRRYYGES
jgi:hypothetical protein